MRIHRNNTPENAPGETMRNHAGLVALTLAALASSTGLGAAADIAPETRAIRAVEAEGRGNKEATLAWRKLAREPARALPEILAALDGANPIAANYLRSAVETIAQRELDDGGKLPAAELEKFVRDTHHDPRGRRLAYELLAGVDPSAPNRIIPGMLNDPSVEFRRDAVARLLAEAPRQLAAGRQDEARRSLARALSGARDDDQVQAIKKQLEALGEKVDLPQHFGFLVDWRLIAPFDNTEQKGLAAVYPPEKEIDFAAIYEGKEGKRIAWVEHHTSHEYGIVDVAKAVDRYKGAVAYAAAGFQSDEERPVEFRLGTPNAWKVWLNGELIFAREEYHRGMNLDQYKMRGRLRKGKNIILLKVCQNEQTEDWAQTWQFQFRVCDAVGTGILSADRKPASPAAGSGGQ
jgi:hypothetical protein